jgi:AcrB/AcrD/AcrF family
VVSGLVSLTLTPMLCKRYLHPGHDARQGRVYHALGHLLDAALRGYGVTLRWAFEHRVPVMALGLAVLLGTAWEFWTIRRSFLPEEDLSQIWVSTDANQGISFDAMKAHQETVNQIVQAHPNVVQFFSTVSASNSSGLNNGRAFLHLKDPPERPWTDSAQYDRLDEHLHDHRHPSDRDRLRGGRRRQALARSVRRRRPHLRAVRDPLPHARLLYVHGRVPAVAPYRRRRTPGGSRSVGRGFQDRPVPQGRPGSLRWKIPQPVQRGGEDFKSHRAARLASQRVTLVMFSSARTSAARCGSPRVLVSGTPGPATEAADTLRCE